MKEKITHEDLVKLLTTAVDDAGNHVLWIDEDFHIHLHLLGEGVNSDEFAQSQPSMIAKVQTLTASNGYVGPEAANDKNWITCLLSCLNDFEATPGKITQLRFT